MANLYEQRNLSMTPDQWRALEAVAVETNSRSTRGPDAYQHSWRKIIHRIADGEFRLVPKNPHKLPEGLDKAIEANARRALPGQQPLFEMEAEPA